MHPGIEPFRLLYISTDGIFHEYRMGNSSLSIHDESEVTTLLQDSNRAVNPKQGLLPSFMHGAEICQW